MRRGYCQIQALIGSVLEAHTLVPCNHIRHTETSASIELSLSPATPIGIGSICSTVGKVGQIPYVVTVLVTFPIPFILDDASAVEEAIAAWTFRVGGGRAGQYCDEEEGSRGEDCLHSLGSVEVLIRNSSWGSFDSKIDDENCA